MIGRIIYGIGYFGQGPKGRLIGAIIGDIVVLALIGLSIASFFFTLKDSTLLLPLISILCITITCFFIGFFVAGSTRDKIMNDNFVKKFETDQKSLLKDATKQVSDAVDGVMG